jgi:hypothetical protein
MKRKIEDITPQTSEQLSLIPMRHHRHHLVDATKENKTWQYSLD